MPASNAPAGPPGDKVLKARQEVAAGRVRQRRRRSLLARTRRALGGPTPATFAELNELVAASAQLVAASRTMHRFAWQPAQTEKNPPTLKAVWTGPGQRRDLYGAAAKKALAQSAGSQPSPTAPASPSAPTSAPSSATVPAATPAATAPTPASAPGRARRAAGVVGTGAKATGKAAWTVAGKLQQATAWTVEKTMRAMVRAGEGLKRFAWLERQLGLGRLIERDASRKLRRAMAVKAAAAAGGLSAGTAAFVGESAKLAGLRWRGNKRKYGTAAAVVMEAAYLGLSVTKKLKGLLLGVPVLSIALKPIAGVVGVLANAATRGALNFVGKRLLSKREVKRNKNAPGRVAQRMDKTSAPVALPGAVIGRARDIRHGAGPGPLVPTAGATTSRSRKFAEEDEAPAFDPAELVRDLRGMVEEATGEPLDMDDGELAQVVSLTARLLEAKAAG